jgi:DNA sulfur modification protein DndC
MSSHTHSQPTDLKNLTDKIRQVRRMIRQEYLQNHSKPWIIGFSGGKDSTLVLQLVVETLLAIAPDERNRKIYVLSNDTLVESPVYQSQVVKSLARVKDGVEALDLPIEVVQTSPDEDWTFWVNMLGRGYPAPNRNFRWCTDRMKIRPTTQFIKEKVSASGEVILLLGVRKAESSARAQRIEKYQESDENKNLSPHNDVKGCFIFRPIVDLSNDEVWLVLMNLLPPWGGNHIDLMNLYKNARGGECPFVLSKEDSPSCGSNSARFGCWTCTVVDKDNSLNGLIDSGYEYLEPLSQFRDRIRQISNSPDFRSKVRRNGQAGLGPLTLEARKMLLQELLDLQAESGLELISNHEVRLIKDWWGRDETTTLLREMDQLTDFTNSSKELG